MSHGQSSPFWYQDSAPYISTCLRFPAFVWLLLFSLSRTGPGGPHGQGPPFWERARAKSLPGHNTPSRHSRPATLVHYSILSPHSPGICKYAVWTTSEWSLCSGHPGPSGCCCCCAQSGGQSCQDQGSAPGPPRTRGNLSKLHIWGMLSHK